jgi:hypothetical protein
MVTIFQDVKRNYENNLGIIKQTEDELNDLYHECELADPKDMYGGWKMYRAIRDARIRRRTAKEENQILKDMYEYLNTQAGQAFKSKMQSIQGSAAKIRLTQESRIYQPRQRDDLTITNKHSSANKPFEQMLKEFNQNKAYVQGGKFRK